MERRGSKTRGRNPGMMNTFKPFPDCAGMRARPAVLHPGYDYYDYT